MVKKKINYIITDNNITVNYDGQTHIISRKDVLADKLITAVRNQQLDQIPDLVSASRRVEIFGKGDFVVKDGQIFVNGVLAPKVLGDKILKFSNEGLPHEPLVRFAENLQKNPSFRAVNELFQFLEKNDHPLTDDGNFIAYKKVRADFKDIHSGTFDNSIGKTPEMPRNQVNEDSNQTCSEGLHVANWDYAHNKFSSSKNASTDIMLEVEVNPADVVSIPVDYDQSKMRVCKYKVLAVVDQEHSSDVSLRHTNDSCSNTVSDEDEDEEEDCTCVRCDQPVSDYDELCDDCYLADCYLADEDEEEEEEEEEDSDYPFEDENL
jgi:hypothetical protein